MLVMYWKVSVILHTCEISPNLSPFSSTDAFAPLNDDDYELAMRRVRELLDLDFEAEAAKSGAAEIMWAVFVAFTK